jgi:hypothetical protein
MPAHPVVNLPLNREPSKNPNERTVNRKLILLRLECVCCPRPGSVGPSDAMAIPRATKATK